MLGSPPHSHPPSWATKTKTTKKKFTQSPPKQPVAICHFFFTLPSKSRCWDDASLAKLEVHDCDTSDLRRPRGRRKNPKDRVPDPQDQWVSFEPWQNGRGPPVFLLGERSSKELFQLLFFRSFRILRVCFVRKKTASWRFATKKIEKRSAF